MADEQDPGDWKLHLESSDGREKFYVEHMYMHRKFYAQKKIIPVTFPDAMSYFFSKHKWERKFMAWFWSLLLRYCDETPEDNDDGSNDAVTDMIIDPEDDRAEIFDYKSSFPVNYTSKGGPVPIPFGSRLVPYTGIVPSNYYKHENEFSWKLMGYRIAVLAIRAVSTFHGIRVSAMADVIARDLSSNPCLWREYQASRPEA